MNKELNVKLNFKTSGQNYECPLCKTKGYVTYSPPLAQAYIVCPKCGQTLFSNVEPFKYKIIALMGEAGSGKDFLLKAAKIRYPNYHSIVSCTTRPPREGEVNGEAYHFLTDLEFENKIRNGEMFEHVGFRGWSYGTSSDSLSATGVNIGVFNAEGIRQLMANPRVELKVFWVAAAPKTRLLRQLNREENPDVEEVIRRFGTDEEDFSKIDFPYETISNESAAFSAVMSELDKLVWAD
jgi:guanylate kinase